MIEKQTSYDLKSGEKRSADDVSNVRLDKRLDNLSRSYDENLLKSSELGFNAGGGSPEIDLELRGQERPNQ